MRRSLILVCSVLMVCSQLQAEMPLANRLAALIEDHPGEVSVGVKNLLTKESYFYEADRVMPTASLIKFPIMIELYRQAGRGALDLRQWLTLEASDKVPGSGLLTDYFQPGTRISLLNAIGLMISQSDNTATNLVLDEIGLRATNQTMKDLGCPETQINAKVYLRETSIDPDRSRRFGLGSTTAREMVQLLEMLDQGQLVSKAACEAMLAHLKKCNDRTKMARFLPAEAVLFHKTGAVAQSRTDAGLIQSPAGTLAVCILTTANQDRSWRDDNAANVLCGKLALEIYQHFNPTPADQPGVTLLASGAHGRLVEAVQRTLNTRLKPSPDLSVDGDFGPRTEAAVIRLQRSAGLMPSGQLDRATWKALGRLQMAERAVAEPAEVNARKLPRDQQDSLDGPPFVTCKAWAIVDAASGDLLAGYRARQPFDPASTTKIMTGFVVLKQVTQNPALLDQEITFSQRADDTVGSTSGLRTGEILPVGDLLYGLLLPSGNDASVALAEHVGALLPGDGDAYRRFIRCMNEYADRIGLRETRYRNPHGLTAVGHQSSARDLAKLAVVALQIPRFREIVDTRQYGVTVEATTGYSRNLLWKNTNRLLEIDGYAGVKTGTTRAAGACLVSTAQRNGRQLVLVVLGSSSSDARYADTRNLYRWAWQQVAQGDLPQQKVERVEVSEEARRIHEASNLFDGHNDLPWQFRERGMPSFEKLDISKAQPELHTDIPRLRSGGVKAQFWSVYVPVEVGEQGKALLTTLEQIDLVKRMIKKYPDTFALAMTTEDIERIQGEGKIASLIGMEGGHCIENSINVLRQLYAAGARYMTLTHSSTLDWADSATDEAQHQGLNAFGEEVVREMNRLGMLVDISHVSIETMKDAIRVSQAPVMFSHSSARAIADHPRNVPDDVLRLTAENGGVVMVNFYPSFVVPSSARRSVERTKYQERLAKQGLPQDEVGRLLKRWESRHPMDVGSIHHVVDHIDHIVRVAGIDHVGIGSDYDGIDAVPEQLEDVSTYPRITQELLNRGYSAAQIGKILGGNLMRVMKAAEAVARRSR
ncbi:MAG: hypothetical protein GY768_25310 [Planctomycetaceae bacterium]|nr:hypothetical protein [Planctomycetaceae bacterium]